jgi:hypothetical protein
LIYFNSIERTEVERNFPILDKVKTMKTPLIENYLEFVKLVNCVQYKDGFLVQQECNLIEPIDAVCANRYKSSLDSKFELEYSEHHFSTIEMNELCFVTKK